MKRANPFVPEEMLIEKLKKRDQIAFQWLYDQYSPALYGVVKRIVQDDEQAKDLLQDIFVKIWKNLDSYDPAKGRLFTWLLNVSRNTAIDALRARKTNPTAAIRVDEESVHIIDQQQHATQPSSDQIDLQDVVTKLRPDRKILIDLVYFAGYTQEEAAKLLNIPLGTVKTRIRSAVQELKIFFNS